MTSSAMLAGAYVAVLSALFAYGLSCFLHAALRLRAPPARQAPPLEAFPHVTVQLPVYNEQYVLGRLLDAVLALDWPRDRLQIQVLDDSTDVTRAEAAARVRACQEAGFDAEHLTRPTREGYKAGALAHAMRSAKGRHIAVFDADFVPRPDFLRRTVAELERDPAVACVQTRWTHINAEYSWLTRAQAVGIDGHFGVEQRVRDARGLLLNFNGTAGVWRRRAIEEAGGWSSATVAEDLDLSYRAQLRGWRITYLDDVESPAEIPVQIHALKRQQFRWAKGSIQCFRRHARAVATHPRLRPAQKAFALLHLSHYLVHPLMLALSLILVPIAAGWVRPPLGAGMLLVSTFGPPTMYLVGQRMLHPESWRRRARWLLPLTLVGVGLALSNTRAVLEGLARDGGSFRRTPKFRIEKTGDSWRDKRYALRLDWSAYGECALALLMLAATGLALATGAYVVLPWLVLFAASYGTVFGLSLAHHLQIAKAPEAAHAPAPA